MLIYRLCFQNDDILTKQIAANVFGAYKGSTKKDQLKYSYNSVFPNLRNGFNNFSIDRRIKLTGKLHQCA